MLLLQKTTTSTKTIFTTSLLFSTTLFLASCNSSAPLRGNYPASYTYTVPVSKDKVWDKLVSFFTANAIPIKTIDKASGILVSDTFDFSNSYTREDSLGHLANPNAFIVINFKCGTPGFKPGFTGIINVQVTDNGGTANMTVTINNINTNATQFINAQKVSMHSTGVLEKQIDDFVSK
jgi:hypothetical protein